jgi:hypothetical protein
MTTHIAPNTYQSRRHALTNVVVRQTMRSWTGQSCNVDVQVFDVLHLLGASDSAGEPQPPFAPGGPPRPRTFQNVGSYYHIRLTVQYRR